MQELEPFFPGSLKASARYFDGDSDYVELPALDGGSVTVPGAFDTITVETWVKWFDVTGNHPIMNEDHWDRGDLHYQIYNSEFGFDVNGAGDQTFTWQPQALEWYFISVTYSTTNQHIKLSVNNQLIETNPCPTCVVPITLDSPRIGSWLDGSSTVARSMHGQMSVFRIWNIEPAGAAVDACPAALTDGLVAQYIFGAGGNTAKDTSGNGYDGTFHDAGWSDELPPSQQCQKQGFGGLFDGDGDYVTVPDLGEFTALTYDLWVKFDVLDGEHPIVMEDGWQAGAIHLQIYGGKFLVSTFEMGNLVFNWQPVTDTWYFISVSYVSATGDGTGSHAGRVHLSVDNLSLEDTRTGSGQAPTGMVLAPPGTDPAQGTACPCILPGGTVTLHNPRLGGWLRAVGSTDVAMDRSMRGSIAVFRLWDKEKNGVDKCPASGTSHLVVNYLFDSLTDVVKDRSGNNHDGQMHETKMSGDYPDLGCIFHSAQIYKMMTPVAIGEHGTTTVGCSACANGGSATHVSGGASQPPIEIELTGVYTNPVVVAGVLSENGGDSAVVRIQNLRKYGVFAAAGISVGSVQYNSGGGRRCNSAWCFDMFLQEPSCLDQWHADEQVAWIVMEAGSYVTNEKNRFQAGTVAAQGSQFETARFHHGFHQVPAVITHVQSTNDPNFVKTRQQSAGRRDFQVALERDGGDGINGHGLETVGWIAFEASHGTIGNLQYEAGITPEEVTEQIETVTFTAPFSTVPKFFAMLGSYNGHDSSQLRMAQAGSAPSDNTAQSIVIEEESCSHGQDDCAEAVAGNQCHPMAETVSWLAIGPTLEHTGNFDGVGNTNDASVIMARHSVEPLVQFGEEGTVTVNTLWLTVSLSQNYRKPVAFCSIPSLVGSDPVACRIRRMRYSPVVRIVTIDAQTGAQNNNAQNSDDSCPGGGWCFDIALQEPQCLDQFHTDETVSWMVGPLHPVLRCIACH